MLVFCSYTLKDGLITIEKLKELKMLIHQFAQSYIDILDNDSFDRQRRVIEELKKSKLLLVIKSPDIMKSDWVRMEFTIAKEQNIPIIEIDISQFENIKNIIADYL